MTTLATGTGSLTRDALAVLQPGFTGTSAPDWLLRQLAEGLTSVGLFGRNIASSEQLAALTAQLREVRPEVLVAVDEEGGDVTRLEARTGSSFPGNLALGHIDDTRLTRAVAHELGSRLAACGVNLDWAPSADVNSDPDNPVIGVRSFGDDPRLVARHTVAYVEGLQAAGVAACVKHFPGHGDTAVDSHHALPRIDAGMDTLRERELVPFQAAIDAGAKGVMSAHILLPALDADLPGTAAATYAATGGDLAARVLADAGDRRIVAVVRDVHRHPWMSGALDALLAARPGTVVVEMGVPQAPPAGALHIATHGAARVCGRAAAEVIAGTGR
jgi:beta-N-acetylhexosaminidase